ncbi:SET domain-containing protein [Sparassis crispa]|uniref:SET domain-containing protein n=1 Tax=Sparassis crispa TaxID=139825 RepID=A0A401GS26_9APHY|nr:SET domain-containing protein [Sparassis crispa]GBE85025.1 SET domain-containing protein [Sparassis crispa]
MCKFFNRYVASPEYQSLSQHEQVDAILLSQLLAEMFPDNDYVLASESDSSFSTFIDLLKSSDVDIRLPPLCRASSRASAASEAIAIDLYSRFGNNNFVLHSHLTPYAHGIFPLASRLFNHSCVPNAVARYIITPSESVCMEIVTLRPVAAGEEITIPYLDPALSFHTRQQALRMNYGFTCSCPLCSFTRHISPTPPPSRGSVQLEALETMLRTCVFGIQDRTSDLPHNDCQFSHMPAELYSLLHESYLPDISEIFSRSSHEGQYKDALEVGLTLLALYVLLYPCNYPQIGMHALEMSKTAWNAAVAMKSPTEDEARLISEMEQAARSYLRAASQTLSVLGSEGDAGGPLEEIRILSGLLNGDSA